MAAPLLPVPRVSGVARKISHTLSKPWSGKWGWGGGEEQPPSHYSQYFFPKPGSSLFSSFQIGNTLSICQIPHLIIFQLIHEITK